MNQLTIEELSAYLPYKVKVKLDYYNSYGTHIIGEKPLTLSNYKIIQGHSKLLLRPLSQLTTEIEVNGEKFVPMEKLYNLFRQTDLLYFDKENILNQPYVQIKYLLSLHFDIFGLIDRNLAEPIV